MDVKATVVSSPSVEGNIGSCSVQTTENSVGVFTEYVVFTNSCTGEVVKEAQYLDWGSMLFVAFMVIGMTYLAQKMYRDLKDLNDLRSDLRL